jgi:hypothetical protein
MEAMFFRNAVCLLTDYMTLHLRRQKFSALRKELSDIYYYAKYIYLALYSGLKKDIVALTHRFLPDFIFAVLWLP